MTGRYQAEYRDPEISRRIAAAIRAASRKKVRLMEVCGTHTVSIFKSGIRSVLPTTISLISGPGCPVCVTAQGEIDAFVRLARLPEVIVATFGDLIRVPGSESSLLREKAAGADVRVVYSTVDALDIARNHPDRRVVFLGVGFETTAPTVAASILTAAQEKLDNYMVYSAHKTVPPALEALMRIEHAGIDGFLLPGHVSVIIGLAAYRPFFESHRTPCVIAGFEPADLLKAIQLLVDMIEGGCPDLANAYGRAVRDDGNPKARQLMETVFEPAEAVWRGLGEIPASGLHIREAFCAHDASHRLNVRAEPTEEPRGCACGAVLTGVKTPTECPLYRRACTPDAPVGPCMVSGEGTCAAYYRYHREP